MTGLAVRTKTLTLKEGKKPYGVITGIIGMASESLTGSMVISFSESCILRIYAKMTASYEKERIDSEVIDGVGELTNMICGGAKNRLAKMNMKFDLAIPATIMGRDVEIGYMKEVPTIVIPFATEAGNFVVEANLAKK